MCKVEEAGGLRMRTAPCQAAPVSKKGALDVVVPQGASFTYLDRNSRQSSDCVGYGYPPVDIQVSPDYCWVLGSYNGVTGWVPVLETGKQDDLFFGEAFGFWTSALCTFADATRKNVELPRRLVSDDGSPTGCAELTRDLNQGDACFPADATVMLRDGTTIQMSELQLGDEVAVRQDNGAVAWEPVYAFGHKDPHTTASYVMLTAVTNASNRQYTVQVCCTTE